MSLNLGPHCYIRENVQIQNIICYKTRSLFCSDTSLIKLCNHLLFFEYKSYDLVRHSNKGLINDNVKECEKNKKKIGTIVWTTDNTLTHTTSKS